MIVPEGLEIKPSPIHGLGVFAKRTLKKGERLGEFLGDRYSLREFKEKYGKDIRYCYVERRENYVLCAKENRNWITYCNESGSPNLVLKQRWAVVKREVKEGKELFLHYGNDYPRDYSLN